MEEATGEQHPLDRPLGSAMETQGHVPVAAPEGMPALSHVPESWRSPWAPQAGLGVAGGYLWCPLLLQRC